jgi:hypothetical protein
MFIGATKIFIGARQDGERQHHGPALYARLRCRGCRNFRRGCLGGFVVWSASMSGLGSAGNAGENDEDDAARTTNGTEWNRSKARVAGPCFLAEGERLLPSVGLLARGSCCAPSPFPEAVVVDVQPRVVWEVASPVTVAGPRRLFTGLPFYALTGTESIFYSVVRKELLPPAFCGECQGDPGRPRNGTVANRPQRGRKPRVTGARRIDPSGCERVRETRDEVRRKSCGR